MSLQKESKEVSVHKPEPENNKKNKVGCSDGDESALQRESKSTRSIYSKLLSKNTGSETKRRRRRRRRRSKNTGSETLWNWHWKWQSKSTKSKSQSTKSKSTRNEIVPAEDQVSSVSSTVFEDARDSCKPSKIAAERGRSRKKLLRRITWDKESTISFFTFRLGPQTSTSDIEPPRGRKSRAQWKDQVSFFTGLIATLVGSSNVLDFPYKVYRYGRGTFLVLHALMTALFAVPLVFLELSVGQLSRRGAVLSFEISPLFMGVGLFRVLEGLRDWPRYAVNIVYCGRYMTEAFSFSSGDPLEVVASCANAWNTHACVEAVRCDQDNHIRYLNGSCSTVVDAAGNEYVRAVWNMSAFETATNLTAATPGFEFFKYQVQDSKDVTSDNQHVLNFSLLLGLVLVFLSAFIFRVLLQLGWGTAVLPSVYLPMFLLVCVAIKGFTTTGGGSKIIEYLLTPDWAAFVDPEVYLQALTQVVRSLSIGSGFIVTLGSYCLGEDVLQPAIKSVAVNYAVSIIAALAVFSLMGGIHPDLLSRLPEDGSLLIYDVYASAAARDGTDSLLGLSFFLMTALFGLSTVFVNHWVVETVLLDQWPDLRKKKMLVIFAFTVVIILCGLPFVTKGGALLSRFVGHYCNPLKLFIGTAAPLVIIHFVYGYQRLSSDLQARLIEPPSRFLRFLGPVSLLALALYCTVLIWTQISRWVTGSGRASSKELEQAMDLYGSGFWRTLGWLFYLFPYLCILTVAGAQLARRPAHETLRQRVAACLAPSERWTGAQLRYHRRHSPHF